MMRSALLVAVSALAVANAQNYSTSGNLTITASEIPASLRQSWCRGQTIACPEICGGRASQNTCDADQLTYNCVCPDNQPRNISNYAETLPFFICQQWIANCVDNHPNDLDGQTACQSVTCGSQNATEAESSQSASASASATASATTTRASGTGASATSGTATPSATQSGAAIALNLAQNYGTGLLALVGAAVFGIAM